MSNENFLDIASIKFGNTRFLIKQTQEASKYFIENFQQEELNKLMPSAGEWYNQVLGFLRLDHKIEAEIEAVIYSIKSFENKELVNGNNKVEGFDGFIESPLKLKDKREKEEKLVIKFALRIKDPESKKQERKNE
ncbi:MAG TPA: hypothetical protein VJ912_00815 [Candidatus Nanoarchaeia archaeon]|nr:hypothetical protein [Candidatus Nanoarchaeia archaeon]